MKIISTYWNEVMRETIHVEHDVILVKNYQGHDIYQDDEGWLYVKAGDNYQYFGTIREAQKFIRDTEW